MSREVSSREYTRMTSSGKRNMTNKEVVEEAKDTVKIGRRKGICGKDTLESFFNGGSKDQSICREGLIDLQNGIEMLIKGTIQYYGESYKEEHFTRQNAEIIENLSREFPETRELREAVEILDDDNFSFTMFKCSKYPRYSTFKTDRQFRNLAYIVLDTFIRYADKYILVD